jgi:hypothetical protein
MRFPILVTKDTNPKDAVGIRKVPMSTVPSQPVMEMALAMLEGGIKYGRHNYRVAGVRASVYYDAAHRHLTAWWEGQDIDPDSGLPHLAKAMACLCVIRDSVIRGNWVDDRPPAMPDNWQVALNKKAGDLLDHLPPAKAAYTNLSVTPSSELQPCSQTPCPTEKSQQELPLQEDYSWVKVSYPPGWSVSERDA